MPSCADAAGAGLLLQTAPGGSGCCAGATVVSDDSPEEGCSEVLLLLVVLLASLLSWLLALPGLLVLAVLAPGGDSGFREPRDAGP